MVLKPTKCPNCKNVVVRNDVIRGVSFIKAQGDGSILGKCGRCKAWVSLPLKAFMEA